MTRAQVQERVNALIDHIQSGKILEAMTVRRVHAEAEPERLGAPVDRLVPHVLGVLSDTEVTFTLDILDRFGI